MAKTNSKPTKRRRKPLPRLQRQTEQKSLSRPMQMPRAEILTQLHDTLAACEELFRAHGDGCSCELCCLTSNLVGTIRVFHMLAEIT